MNIKGVRDILGILSAFQTILENYPKLLAGDYYGGRDSSFTAISFLLDILKIFGISDEFLYRWLSNLLLDEEDSGVKKGLLTVIEEAIKAILLSYITGLYTCPIDPVIPDSFLRTPYINSPASVTDVFPTGEGITIPVSKIDAFGLLQNCPTSKRGSVFYFDTSGLTQSQAYMSTDFNSYLWYVINKGNGSSASTWDNRVHYRRKITGSMANRDRFVNERCVGSPSEIISGIGIKKQIVYCQFIESAAGSVTDISINSLNQGNAIRVWGVSDRYYRAGINLATTAIDGGRLNKTVFQFNTDYIYSLKLFDSKTIVAQIINAMLGISGALSGNFSLQMNILIKKVEKLVEKVIEMEDYGDKADDIDGYFLFSDEEYNDITNDATLRYNGQYATGNDENEYVDVDKEAITTYIEEIGYSMTPEDKENAIMKALMKVGGNVSSVPEIDISVAFSFNKNLIFNFIKEAMIQISMQVLSPKVMLIFAINSHFLCDTQENITDSMHWEGFFRNFWNVLRSCIKKISSLIIQELFDLVIGQIKPIMFIVAKKLMLEAVYYYRKLLEELILACTKFKANTTNLIIDNVNYADIIPVQTAPNSKESNGTQ